NNPTGAYGARTYAAPSNVNTDTDQFSIRIDQKVGAKGQLFGRFNYDNLTGPTTNPDQTLLDPSFGVQYVDRQRNGVITYTRTASPRFLWSTSLSLTRTTPSFVTPNHTDPALKFNDGLYEAYNSAAGSVISAFGNLFQLQLNFAWTTARHAVKWGTEARLNRDTTYFGISPNGEYDFGGGTVYSPVFIPSASGRHDVQPGQSLPDTLSSLLLGFPYAYTIAVAPPYASNGAHIGPGAITVIPPNIWQDNLLTGSTPYVVYPRVNAAQNGEISYGFQITPDELPQVYNTAGVNVLASGNPKNVPANTVMDVNRYQQDLAALAPSHQLSLLSLAGIDRRFGNGYLQTWTLGLERVFGGLTADVAYVGTSAFRLPRMSYPNAYPGAGSEFARFTDFDGSGVVTGGFGFESVMTATSHSSYNALQTSLSGNVGHGGPSLQAGYTWGKSLDDVSGIIGGTGSTGAVALFSPQTPFDTRGEKVTRKVDW